MIGLPQLKARIARLEKLAAGLSDEMAVWEAVAGQLLLGEPDMYLEDLRYAVIGLEGARDTLEGAVLRLEDEARNALAEAAERLERDRRLRDKPC